jgi:hypothetical protein
MHRLNMRSMRTELYEEDEVNDVPTSIGVECVSSAR